VIEASELVAADVFTAAEQIRERVTLVDVERHSARLAGHAPLGERVRLSQHSVRLEDPGAS
jgi:hypothetical protein